MSTPWREDVRHTVAGEAVRAGIDGRPTRDLAEQTRYLKERLDNAGLGSALVAHDLTLITGLRVGDPVWFNTVEGRVEAAFADYLVDAETGVIRASDESIVLGLLLSKASDTLGSVLLQGRAKLSIKEQTGETTPAGGYFLSTRPGELVKGPPATGPFICTADGAGYVYVSISLRNFADSHVHYKFSLICKPSGTYTPDEHGRQVITDWDADKEGWLPANHSSFNGKAPAAAAFGYNLILDDSLNSAWPPAPLDSVVAILDRADGMGGRELPTGASGLILFDRNGIWWLSDCPTDVPWPATVFPGSDSDSEPSSSLPECPRREQMRLTLYFSRQTFATDQTVVTSLRSGDGIKIVCTSNPTKPGTTGDLTAVLDSDFVYDATAGSLVPTAPKELKGKRFLGGPILTALQAHEDGSVRLSSVDNKKITIDGEDSFFGVVRIQATLEPGERSLLNQIVRQSDVRNRFYEDVPYLGFPAGQESSIRCKVQLPFEHLPISPRVKLRLTIFSRSAGTTPALTVSYRILSRSVNGAVVALSTSDTTLTIDTETVVDVNEYFECSSAAITVTAGDIILFTIQRNDDDGFAGEVGLLDVVAVLYPESA